MNYLEQLILFWSNANITNDYISAFIFLVLIVSLGWMIIEIHS